MKIIKAEDKITVVQLYYGMLSTELFILMRK